MSSEYRELYWVGAAGLLAAVLVASVGASRIKDRPHPPTYEEQREKFVLIQSAIVGKVDTLILGDSITESNILDGLCGKTFNAGIGGAATADMVRLAPIFVARTHPRYIVVAVGTNDALAGNGGFRRDYATLLSSLPAKPIALVGARRGDNRFIAAEATRIGARYVPPLDPSLTWDGIHPTVQGAMAWRASVGAACPSRPSRS